MWVRVYGIEGATIVGLLANEPGQATHLGIGDPVETRVDKVDDWMFVRNGEVTGGFSIEALSQMQSD